MNTFLRYLLPLGLLLVPCLATAQSDPSTFPLTSVCDLNVDVDGDCISDAVDDEVCVRGIVTAWKQFGSRGPGAIRDPDSGCCVSIFDISNAPDLPIGTYIEVCGWVGNFAGLLEIVDNPANGSEDPVITVLDPGPLPTPATPVSCADLADDSPLAESLESCLVQLCGSFVDTGDFGTGSANYAFVDLDGNSCQIRIDSDTGIGGTPIPVGNVTVVGVLSQFNEFQDTCIGYQVLPRSLDDFGPPVCEAKLDIKPGSCPNPLNGNSNGVLPVALVGTEDFDVSQVDVSTLTLEGVAPLRWSHEDVTAPFDGILCDCIMGGQDGIMDLTLKFDVQAIIAAVGPPLRGDRLMLTLSGARLDGSAFIARDCVKGVGHVKPEPVMGDVLQLEVPSSMRASTQRVEFSLADVTPVTLSVYDAAGRVVKSLLRSDGMSGRQSVEWRVGGLANGVYFYRLIAGDQVATKKFLVLR